MDSVNIRLSILTETTVELLEQLCGLEGASSIDETGNINYLLVLFTVYIFIVFRRRLFGLTPGCCSVEW